MRTPWGTLCSTGQDRQNAEEALARQDLTADLYTESVVGFVLKSEEGLLKIAHFLRSILREKECHESKDLFKFKMPP